MTQDPKKLPAWLKNAKKTEEPPPSEPPSSETGTNDADVPPWLRDEVPPPPSKVRRVAPPPDRQGTGDLPPWLAGAEEEAQPKSYKIGGTELSEEYFAAADALPETTDSGMTFDAWIAEQAEAKREKDIEEEVPDDLLDAIASEPPPPKGTGSLKQTGQLPDWFLGLESLDTTEAPEWFQNEDEAAPQSAATVPTWMSDMMDEPEEQPAEELPPADEIGSFFSSLGGMPEDEETPEIDWYDQADLPDDAGQTFSDDFFTNLVSGGVAEQSTTPQTTQPLYDDFDDFEQNNVAPPAQGAVEIPQNELDAFFSDLASGREAPSEPEAASVSMDDIEDPDLEWVADEEPVIPEPEPYVPPEAPAELAEENNSWLNELQGIVSGATRMLPSLPDEDVAKLGTQNFKPDEENAPAAASAAAEEFSWPELNVGDEPEPEASLESDWLSGITPDEAAGDAEPPEETVIAPRSRMTERLYREPEPAVDDAANDWDSLFSTASASDTGLSDESADEALFASNMNSPSEGESLFGSEIDFGQGELDTADDASVFASDLQTGWLRNDLFADENTATESVPASAPRAALGNDSGDVDFFSRLESDANANLIDEQSPVQSQWSDEDALSEADFMSALDSVATPASQDVYDPWQQPTESAEPEDDFFSAMGLGDESTAPANQDVYDPWQEQQPAASPSQDDEFFAALGLDEGENSAPQPGAPLYDAWQEQPAAASAEEEDIFAALGMNDTEQPAASENDDLYAQPAASANEEIFDPWQEQQPSDAGEDTFVAQPAEQDDDFFANLNLDTEAAAAGAEEPFGMPDLFEQWSGNAWQDAQTEQPAQSEDLFTASVSEPTDQVEDFFANLSLDNENASPETEEEAGVPDNLFQQWEAEQPVASNEAADELPEDFFSVLDIGGRSDEPDTAAPFSNEDLFAQWEAEDNAEPSSGVGDDFLATLGISSNEGEAQPAEVGDDPFANWDTETQADIPPSEDFFAALDTMVENQAYSQPEEPANVDFFASLAEPKPPPPAFTDVDSYLASLSEEPTTGMLKESFQQNQEIDLDKLFSETVASETPKAPAPQSQADLLPGADQDWLAQMHTSVGEVSASAIVRQKEDRPVEELPERLRKLRERTEAYSGGAPAEADDALAPVPEVFVAGTPGLGQEIALTPEQEKNVALLRTLVPSDSKRQEASRMSAIEATYDSPYMPDLEDTPEVTLQPASSEKAKSKRRARRRRRLNIRFDRFIVAIVLAAAVILPFTVPGFRIGSLPPSSFAAGSRGETAFDQIEALDAGDLVLVGVEYGAASAAELDGVTEALLRHIIMKAAYPVLISSNPVGLLRSEARLNTINQDIDFLRAVEARQPLVANSDYYIVRYLPGSVIGLRAFSGDTANLLLSDIHGQATNLVVRSMRDFALVAVVTDRAEDLRAYAEQIAPLTRAPLLSAVSYGASPLVEPYASSLEGGLLIGYADAYTYTNLLDKVDARSIANRVRIVPTPEPVQPSDSGDALQAAGEQSAEGTEPAARATGLRATPTLAFTPTPVLDTATVISDAPANMRIGPGTENPVLTSVAPGTTVPVLGYNADETWVNVQLPDGRTGWISASLLTINSAQSAAPKLEIYGRRQEVDEGEEQSPTPRPPTATRVFPTLAQDDTEATESADEPEVLATATPRPTRTAMPTATATERPTEEATAEVTEEVAVVSLPPPPPSPGYRDERWYAMNLGVIASALVITLGMVINLVRGLRRGRRG